MPAEDISAEFRAWLRARARECGHDIPTPDRPKAGGYATLAAAAGLPQATVSRLFSGRHAPAIATMRALAPALGVTVGDMLVRSGLVPAEELPPSPPPVTGDLDALIAERLRPYNLSSRAERRLIDRVRRYINDTERDAEELSTNVADGTSDTAR